MAKYANRAVATATIVSINPTVREDSDNMVPVLTTEKLNHVLARICIKRNADKNTLNSREEKIVFIHTV